MTDLKINSDCIISLTFSLERFSLDVSFSITLKNACHRWNIFNIGTFVVFVGMNIHRNQKHPQKFFYPFPVFVKLATHEISKKIVAKIIQSGKCNTCSIQYSNYQKENLRSETKTNI